MSQNQNGIWGHFSLWIGFLCCSRGIGSWGSRRRCVRSGRLPTRERTTRSRSWNDDESKSCLSCCRPAFVVDSAVQYQQCRLQRGGKRARRTTWCQRRAKLSAGKGWKPHLQLLQTLQGGPRESGQDMSHSILPYSSAAHIIAVIFTELSICTVSRKRFWLL